MVMAAEICEELDYKKFQRPVSFPKQPIESQQEAVGLDKQSDLRSNIPIDWYTAVFVLKSLLRHLQRPLSTDEVLSFSKTEQTTIEHIASSIELYTKAGFAFSERILQPIVKYLLFLARNVEESSASDGLTLQLTPSSFNTETNTDITQKFADQVLNRLLQPRDVINRHISVQQTVVNMTSSSTSQHLKPTRVAPPIPKQARPLPPPPVPEHANDNVTAPVMTLSPPVPLRSKSLMCNFFDCDNGFLHLSDSNIFLCSSDDELSDGEPSPNSRFVNKTISHVVNRHLFNAESSPKDQWVERAIASSPLHRHNGISLYNSSTGFTDSCDAESSLHPAVSASSGTVVTTPDSGCGTAEDDAAHVLSSGENREPIIIPKLNLESAIDDDVIIYGVTEQVPPLDLSEISPPDEDTRTSTPSRMELFVCNKPRRRRRSAKSSPIPVTYSPPKPSSPIDIPVLRLPDSHDTDDDVTDEVSPTDGSLRWRDAWSTNEEIIPMHVAMNNVVKRDVRGPVEESLNFELAPSSPENHLPHRHSHHHHHHHKRHHHHDNHLSRPKLSNSLRKEVSNHDHLCESLRDILDALDEQRKDNARPEDLTLMTREQIRMEKAAMQRELLKHESLYGRPSTKEEKEIMRDVYERYRMLKRLLVDAMSPPFSSVTRRFDNFEYDVNTSQQGDDFTVTQLVTLAPPDGKRMNTEYNIEANDHISGDVGLTELRKQHKDAKGKRKRLRKKLQDFEKETEQQYGRAVNQADRLVMADEYREYHGLKLKLRLLDALIEKRNSQFR